MSLHRPRDADEVSAYWMNLASFRDVSKYRGHNEIRYFSYELMEDVKKDDTKSLLCILYCQVIINLNVEICVYMIIKALQ